MPQSLQNIVALLGLLIVGGLGYYLYYADGASILQSGNGEFVISTTEQEAILKAAEFERLIVEINSIELSYNLFEDARFRSLVDFSIPVTPDSIGRDNPFLSTTGALQP